MTPGHPRILFLSPCWPVPGGFGGQLRALHVGRALKAIGDVTLMVVGADAGKDDEALRAAAEFKVFSPADVQLCDSRNPWLRLRRAVDVRYLNVHGATAAPEDRARVNSYIEQHDLVWVLNSRTPSLLQRWHWPHTHLDIDDVPSTYLERIATTEHSPLKRWKAKTQQRLLHRRERHFSERFTTLSVCSEADRLYLGEDRAHVIPNGFARPAIEPARRPTRNPPRIGFIGLYSYAPNVDGVQWFLREVWPSIRAAMPGIRFRLVGKGTDGPAKPTAAGVDVLGWLDDPSDEIATWSAMVVPIRIGGGTRIKVAEAFARKCPLVATPFGAHGYNVQNEKHLLLADSAADFSQACIRLASNHDDGVRLATAAWSEFLEKWTWDAIGPKVWAAAEDCLRRSSSHVAA